MRVAILMTAMVLSACGGTEEPAAPEDQAVESPADPDEAIRAEAERLCPSEFVEPCTDSYVGIANGDKPGALCIDDDAGTWFFETPRGGVGEQCSDGNSTIVAIVGG